MRKDSPKLNRRLEGAEDKTMRRVIRRIFPKQVDKQPRNFFPSKPPRNHRALVLDASEAIKGEEDALHELEQDRDEALTALRNTKHAYSSSEYSSDSDTASSTDFNYNSDFEDIEKQHLLSSDPEQSDTDDEEPNYPFKMAQHRSHTTHASSTQEQEEAENLTQSLRGSILRSSLLRREPVNVRAFMWQFANSHHADHKDCRPRSPEEIDGLKSEGSLLKKIRKR